MERYPISWSHGNAEVRSTAAVLADCVFDLHGTLFRPFARAPWMGTVSDPSIIGHLRELGGDFVCVPFGGGPPAPVGPPEWAELMVDPPFTPIHGPAGDAEWRLVEQAPDGVTLALDYPQDSIIERLERRVAGREGATVLDSTLVIHPRRSGAISVGLHPILRLPETPGRLALEAQFAFGLVHPRQAGEATQEFADLSEVMLADGAVDLSHVPVARPNVSVQLCGMAGPLRARFLDDGAGVELDWDRAILPSLQIWLTDCGIDGPPWHGQFRGIGVEPIASAFDLHTKLSERSNPISARGVRTAVELVAGVQVTINHSVRAFRIEDDGNRRSAGD